MKKVYFITLWWCFLCNIVMFAQEIDYENALFSIEREGPEDKMYYVNIAGERITRDFKSLWIHGERDWCKQHNLYPIEKNGKYGMINSKGEEIFPCIYDYPIDFKKDYNVAIVKKDGKYGIINLNGDLIVPCVYDLFDGGDKDYYDQDLRRCKKNGKYGVIDIYTGKEIVPCLYTDIDYRCMYRECVDVFIDKEHRGFLNTTGKFVQLPFEGAVIEFSKKAKFVIVINFSNKKYGLYDLNGKVVLPCEYDLYSTEGYAMDMFEYGSEIFKKEGVYYHIDLKGRMKRLNLSSDISSIDGSYFLIESYSKKNKKRGLINREGKEIVPCVYNKIGRSKSPNEPTILIDDCALYGCDNLGRIVFSFPLSEKERSKIVNCPKFENGYCIIPLNEKWVVVNTKGTIVSKPDYSKIDSWLLSKFLSYNVVYDFNHGYAKVKKDDFYGYVNTSGEEVVRCIYNKEDADLKYIEYAFKVDVGKGAQYVQVPQNISQKPFQRTPIVENTPPKGSLDVNVPNGGTSNSNTFVFIIGNEAYRRVEPVPYAKNDGEIFAEYCKKTLGVPEKNLHLQTDATLGDIKYYVLQMRQIADAFDGDAKFIFYYAGHGLPAEDQQDAFLLPVDGYGADGTGYSVNELYNELGALNAKSVIVLLDACFSGAKRDGGMIASARGVAIKTKQAAPKGNMVIISAAQGDETAYPYKEQGHGLFTYYLLKKLNESKGNVTLGELADYITSGVKKTSIVENGKLQTPSVNVSPNFSNTWRSMKLK